MVKPPQASTVAVFLIYHNFAWRTGDDEHGRTRLPCAMLSGVADTPWSFEDLSDAGDGWRESSDSRLIGV